MDISEDQKKELEEKIKNMSPEELAELQKKQCLFCQIIDGKIPSKKVYEDDQCLVILDINPASKGHCLIVPKKHISIMPQVSKEELQHLMIVSKEISQILLKSMRCDGTNIFIANGQAAGQMAQHFMIHVIPRKEDDKVLDLEEHVVGLDDRKKIKLTVRKRFNELMNIKEDLSDQEELTKHVEEDLEKDVKELDHEETVDDSKEEVTEEEPVEEPEDTPKVQDKKPDEDQKEEKSPKDNSDVSLDDIANLFK